MAKRFAEHDFDVVVAAEDPGIETAADVLRAFGSQVLPVRADLSTYEGCEQLVEQVRAAGRPVEALALNAGVGSGGPFDETDLRKELDVIAVNVTSTVHLAKRIIPDMVERGAGKVLITSSIAATQPGALRGRVRRHQGLRPVVRRVHPQRAEGQRRDRHVAYAGRDADELLPPGRDGRHPGRVGRVDAGRPRKVAEQGFEALMKGEEKVVAGNPANKVLAAAGRVTPDSVKAATHKLLSKPGSGE